MSKWTGEEGEFKGESLPKEFPYLIAFEKLRQQKEAVVSNLDTILKNSPIHIDQARPRQHQVRGAFWNESGTVYTLKERWQTSGLVRKRTRTTFELTSLTLAETVPKKTLYLYEPGDDKLLCHSYNPRNWIDAGNDWTSLWAAVNARSPAKPEQVDEFCEVISWFTANQVQSQDLANIPEMRW